MDSNVWLIGKCLLFRVRKVGAEVFSAGLILVELLVAFFESQDNAFEL